MERPLKDRDCARGGEGGLWKSCGPGANGTLMRPWLQRLPLGWTCLIFHSVISEWFSALTVSSGSRLSHGDHPSLSLHVPICRFLSVGGRKNMHFLKWRLLFQLLFTEKRWGLKYICWNSESVLDLRGVCLFIPPRTLPHVQLLFGPCEAPVLVSSPCLVDLLCSTGWAAEPRWDDWAMKPSCQNRQPPHSLQRCDFCRCCSVFFWCKSSFTQQRFATSLLPWGISWLKQGSRLNLKTPSRASEESDYFGKADFFFVKCLTMN